MNGIITSTMMNFGKSRAKMTVDGVEQTYYFGLRLDEFGLWQMIELNATEVGEDTLVQK